MEVGLLFFRMILILAAVCALAAITLKWGLRRFLPHAHRRPGGLLEVEERLALGPKQSIYVLRVGSQRHVIASSEAGIHALMLVPEKEENDGSTET